MHFENLFKRKVVNTSKCAQRALWATTTSSTVAMRYKKKKRNCAGHSRNFLRLGTTPSKSQCRSPDSAGTLGTESCAEPFPLDAIPALLFASGLARTVWWAVVGTAPFPRTRASRISLNLMVQALGRGCSKSRFPHPMRVEPFNKTGSVYSLADRWQLPLGKHCEDGGAHLLRVGLFRVEVHGGPHLFLREDGGQVVVEAVAGIGFCWHLAGWRCQGWPG